MTIITFPRPRVVLLSDDVAVELDDTTRLLVTTTATADALIAALHQARDLIEQQTRARAERADRREARQMNIVNEPIHKRWGKTLPGFAAGAEAPTATTVRFVDCECSRHFICDEHVGGGAA